MWTLIQLNHLSFCRGVLEEIPDLTSNSAWCSHLDHPVHACRGNLPAAVEIEFCPRQLEARIVSLLLANVVVCFQLV